MSGITEAILGGIRNLDKRPDALSSAIDTYQGAPRADYSQSNNSTKVAKKITSISKLLESVGSDTFENYQKIEERSAFDTYILSSPEEQKEYKKAVKEHRLAPSQSPFYRRKLELLIAKDSVMGYQQQYAVDYQLAIQSNPNLNLTEWNRNHYSNHVKEHGLNTLSTEAQAAFGKGIESIYISTLAQNMKAKEAAIQTTYDTNVSTLVVSALDSSDPSKSIDAIITEYYPDVGLRAGRGLAIVKDAISGAILESAGSLDGTRAHTEAKYLKALSDVKLLGKKTFGGTAEGKLFIEKLEAAADTQHNKARAAQDLAREQEIKAMIKSHEDSKAEFINKGGTAEQFWKMEEGKRQLAWAKDIGLSSTDASTRTHATLIRNQAYHIRTAININEFMSYLDLDLTAEEVTERAIEFGGFSGEQLKEIQDRTATIKMGIKGADPFFINSQEKSFLKLQTFSQFSVPEDPASYPLQERTAIWAELRPWYDKRIASIPSGLDMEAATKMVSKINTEFAVELTDMLAATSAKKYAGDLSSEEIQQGAKLLGDKIRDVKGISASFEHPDWLYAERLIKEYKESGAAVLDDTGKLMWKSSAAKANVKKYMDKSAFARLIAETKLPTTLLISQLKKYAADPKGWSPEGVVEDPHALAKLKSKEDNMFSRSNRI